MRRLRVACFVSVCLLAGPASGPWRRTVSSLRPTRRSRRPRSRRSWSVRPPPQLPTPAAPAASTPATEAPADATSDPIERAAAGRRAARYRSPERIRDRAGEAPGPAGARAPEGAPPAQETGKAPSHLSRRSVAAGAERRDRRALARVRGGAPIRRARGRDRLGRAVGRVPHERLHTAPTGYGRHVEPPRSPPATRTRLAACRPRRAERSWRATVALAGRSAAAQRARALWRLYRPIGIEGLVEGIGASGGALADLVLHDSRISLTAAGRGDVASGGIDPRVLVSIRYLAESFGQVSVSCLATGHRHFARPGVVSAHVYGRAVDVSAVGGIPIAGHQGPDTVTEHALASLLLLPPQEAPVQVISLVELSGRTLAMGDHGDHIHIGYR